MHLSIIQIEAENVNLNTLCTKRPSSNKIITQNHEEVVSEQITQIYTDKYKTIRFDNKNQTVIKGIDSLNDEKSYT